MMRQKDNTKSKIRAGYESRQRRYRLTGCCLLVLVLSLSAVMMIYGNTIYTPKTIISVLLGQDIKGAVFTIKTLRFPRMLTALLVGWAFGLAGNTFQKLLGNPLASPDIIGITSGASVAAVFGILFLNLDRSVVSMIAVLSGILVSFLIFILSQGHGFSNGRLILTGIGMQSFLGALISWMLLKASEYDVANALRWLSGSLNNVSIDDVPRLAIAVGCATIVIALLNRHLQVLQLGDAQSKTLGLQINLVRLGLILAALILIAFATSVTGPIASVAFLAGPIAGKLTGAGKNNILTSAMVGQILVLASDLVGQYAFSVRYPVGVITGILGAPYLLFLLISMNRKGERA